MTSRHLTRMAGLLLLLGAGTANAQPAPAPAPADPVPATPNAITPPNGVARGVIRPNRPVDSGMVTRPPNPERHNMPVIRPPGTAR